MHHIERTTVIAIVFIVSTFSMTDSVNVSYRHHKHDARKRAQKTINAGTLKSIMGLARIGWSGQKNRSA